MSTTPPADGLPGSPFSGQLRTRVRIGERDPERFPLGDDEALGQSLLAMLQERVEGGKLPRPAVLCISEQEVLQVDLLPVQESGLNVHRFISACTRAQPDIQVLALVGVLGLRLSPTADKSVPALVVFLEMPDCRWWSAQRVLRERALVDELPARIRDAEEGWPRPGGLGGWWSRGRYEELGLQLKRDAPPTVH